MIFHGRVLIGRPNLVDTVARHFEKYQRLPNSLADRVISVLLSEGVYHSLNAELLAVDLRWDQVDFNRAVLHLRS